jgi:hypothetical protein
MSVNFPAWPMMVIEETIPIVNFELFEKFELFQAFLFTISGEQEFQQDPLNEIPDQTQ